VAQAIPSDAAPLLREGRVLAPLRAVFEWLGARVEFDPALGRITGRRDPHIIRLQIGSEAATVDGRAVALDAPAVEVGGRTYVPLRFISEALGAEVDWDAEAHTVTITDGARTGTLQVP
jgi:phage baseplate assembly protein gpV